jgi:hypothetical protein
MRLSTLAVPLFGALTLVACSHKETVVERPVVERQTVIERPVPAAGATVAPACSYGGNAYSEGSLSCQSGQSFRCNDGSWNRTLGSC